MKNLGWDARGFTVIEMVVGLALSGLTLAALIQLFAYFSTQHSRHQALSETADLIQETKLGLQIANVCTLNFRGRPFRSDSSTSLIFNDLRAFDAAGSERGSLIHVGSGHALQRVSNLAIVAVSPLKSDLVAAELRVSFDRSQLLNFASDRTISLTVRLNSNGNRIDSCWVRTPRGSVTDDKICDALSDAPDRDEASRGSCDREKLVWFDGSSSIATCPRNTVLRANAVAHQDCMIRYGADFNDDTTHVSVEYTDGRARSLDRAPARRVISRSENACRCLAALDIPIAQRDQFVCRVRCLTD